MLFFIPNPISSSFFCFAHLAWRYQTCLLLLSSLLSSFNHTLTPPPPNLNCSSPCPCPTLCPSHPRRPFISLLASTPPMPSQWQPFTPTTFLTSPVPTRRLNPISPLIPHHRTKTPHTTSSITLQHCFFLCPPHPDLKESSPLPARLNQAPAIPKP